MIETVIGIEGMACAMCEAHIQDAIRRACATRSVKARRRSHDCRIISADPLDKELLRATIARAGYEMTTFSESSRKRRGLFS